VLFQPVSASRGRIFIPFEDCPVYTTTVTFSITTFTDPEKPINKPVKYAVQITLYFAQICKPFGISKQQGQKSLGLQWLDIAT
jgi:hypothetical protein